jgi:hypothetical protein
MTTENKLDFIQGATFLPWDWRNIGAVFGHGTKTSQCVAARGNFVVRRGYDEQEQIDYGRVVEGLGDLGLNLRSKDYAFHISASNLSYKSGNDAPLRAQSVIGNALASLKFTFAQQYAEDQYIAVSYDLKQHKPEFSLAWSGETLTEKATVAVNVDPIDRAARVRAAVSFPGPEWRDDVYNDATRMIEVPKDDGARHSVFVEHELRRKQLMASTRVGASLDLGRIANCVADYVDYNLEYKIPGIIWRIPLSQRLYNFLVPALDEEQIRHHIKGWALELTHDFDRSGPLVGFSKKLGSGKVAANYDTADKSAGLELRLGGLKAGARLSRQDKEWKNPQLLLMIEPLAFL